MLLLILRRLFWMIPTLVIISIISFAIIQLPPGDYLTSYIAALAESGETVDEEQIEALRMRYALDQPVYVQYFRWIAGMLQGDMGMSFEWNRPVTDLIGERILLTTIISIVTLLVTWGIAVPIGIYSAFRQYSLTDHAFSAIGYVGLATPNFLLALILMYLGQQWFGQSVGGLFSPEFQDAPWSWARFKDLAGHLWGPVIVLGTAGTAYLIRTMRAAVLDELNQMYVMAARAGGLSPMHLLFKYPVRMALNPILATLGWRLTYVISGAPIVGVVMSLPDTGPLFLHALLNQDMYLAGAMVLVYCSLTIIGTFVSDLLLIALDPRIRMEGDS